MVRGEGFEPVTDRGLNPVPLPIGLPARNRLPPDESNVCAAA